MKYKAFAFDLDGTLLVGEHFPPANIEALKRAHAEGVRIFIATARWKEMALQIANQVGSTDPVIACSGAQVYDPTTQRDVFDLRLPADFTERLYEICNADRCIATVTVGNRVMLKLDGEPDMSTMGAEMNWVPQLKLDPTDLPRIGAIQGTAVNARIKDELQSLFTDRVNIFDSIGPTGRIIITITAKGATKGASLIAACEHVGIQPSEVVAFGDAENDLAMFAAAGAAVAMGQANDAVKAQADYVSKPHDQDGVAYAVNHILERGDLPG